MPDFSFIPMDSSHGYEPLTERTENTEIFWPLQYELPDLRGRSTQTEIHGQKKRVRGFCGSLEKGHIMAKRRFIIKALVLLVFVLVGPLGAEGLPPIEIHFVDVGQGDAILIKGTEGANILIDTGNLSAGYRVRRYLKEQKISRLRALVITHMHPDHVGGIFGILPEIGADKIYDNGAAPHKNEFWHEYMNFISDLRLERGILTAGECFSFGNLNLQVLSPSKPLSGNLNVDSIVIRLSYGDVGVLLMADATNEVEKKLVEDRNVNLPSQVLKIGHHGAADATSAAFLERVAPDIAVISVGKSNRYGYPSNETIKRIRRLNAKLYRTDFNGTVVLMIDGKSVNVLKSASEQE